MDETLLRQLRKKVEQQERTVCQLLKIIAATNGQVKELQIKYDEIVQYKNRTAK